jgi:hypothetical protein
MKEVVDATTPIADAAVREAWPYKKVLLAVLPPTLALFSVLIGVWDNGNRDRNARAEAEKDRNEAAAAAEATRADEALQAQQAATKERRLREAELALPKYEQLFDDLHDMTDVVEQCRTDLNAYLIDLRDQGVLLADVSLSAEAALVDPGDPYKVTEGLGLFRRLDVDAGVVRSCGDIKEAIGPMKLSLDKALLVSGESLGDAAVCLTDELRVLSETAQMLLTRVEPDQTAGASDRYQIDIYLREGELVGRLEDGTDTDWFVQKLNYELGAIDRRSEDLIDAVQSVVLFPGEESSAMTTSTIGDRTADVECPPA